MKNNKGFTLVELMAVIVILAIIIAIAVPSAITVSNRIKTKMYGTKIDMILSSAKIYGQDNPSDVGTTNTDDEGTVSISCVDSKADATQGVVKVEELLKAGYIKKDDTENGTVLNPIDNSSLNGHYVCIYKHNNRIYAEKIDVGTSKW